MRDCVLFFVKYPTPGEVKTRLAEASTPELAAEFYRTFAKAKAAELAAGCDADILVCFTPESMSSETYEWIGPEFKYVAQKGVDLGRRMENGFREIFLMGYDRCVLVGSDVPGLTATILQQGLEAITPDSVALGPAEDGGYYLIGFHRQGFIPQVFRDMTWSRNDVFQTTAARIRKEGKECSELTILSDIDTIDDIDTLVALGADSPLDNESLVVARTMLSTGN